MSDDVVDFEVKVLLDDNVGPFARFVFIMADGGRRTLNSLEFSDILRQIYAH